MKLIERSGELAELRGAFAGSRSGKGRVVVVTGGLCTGKSALVHAFVEQLDRDEALVLTATGAASERTLELGVARQLLGAAPLDPVAVARVLDAEGALAAVPDAAGDPEAPLPPRIVDELSTLLLGLVEGNPVVIVVDDLHHVDNASMQVLLHLRRRTRAARLLLVFTEQERPSLIRPLLYAELVRQPDLRVTVGPLSEGAVADMLAEDLDPAAGPRLAAECFARTGGNPLLTSTLIEDQRNRGPYLVSGVADVPAVGSAFRQALVDCLARWEPELVRVAGGLAVLGRHASPVLLADLLEMSPPAVRQRLDTLIVAGLVHRDGPDGLRHDSLGTSLVLCLPPDTAERLHTRAAWLLHQQGAAPVEVARHLVAVGGPPGSWAVVPLRQAAEQAFDDCDFATRCLELALGASVDARDKVELRAALVRMAWRVNPAASTRHLAVLRGALDDGGLAWRDAAPVVRHLLWQGDLATACDQLRAVRASSGPPDERTAAEFRLAIEWTYGGCRETDPKGVRAALATADRADARGNSWRRTGAMLEAWSRGAVPETVRAAEHILQSSLADVLPEVSVVGILALEHADQQDRVRSWCDALEEQARAGGAVTWQALIGWVRAEIARRRGDLAEADQETRRALALLHPQNWGVLIGLPLSTLILANSGMGRHDAVAELFTRPVPEEMFGTSFGVWYLHAVGVHSLASGRTLAALDAFEACASWMRGRERDIPPVVPWRGSLARTYLVLGRGREARDLALEQLNSAAGGGVRLRAMSLRVLADCAEPSNRVQPLREAAQLFDAAGDQLELARALIDLSEVHRELGQGRSARLASRKAEQAAKACAAGDLVGHLRGAAERGGAEQGTAPAPTLSEAERKVAELAAHGHTNREIARNLFITVSTVEQHLTRVYRKLDVHNRADLPARLDHGAKAAMN